MVNILCALCALCASVVKVPVVKSHTKKGAPPMTDTPDWRENGVRIVRSHELDSNTPQSPRHDPRRSHQPRQKPAPTNSGRAPSISTRTPKPAPHHHGELESVIYVVSGKARMRWGDKLEYVAEADAGDFIYVPPFVPHQEINAEPDEPLMCILVRSDQEAIVVNLDIEPAETSETIWIGPNHPEGSE